MKEIQPDESLVESKLVSEVTAGELAELTKSKVKELSWSAAIIVLSMLGACSLNARLDNSSMKQIEEIVQGACGPGDFSEKEGLQREVYALQTQVAAFASTPVASQ